MCLEGPCLLPVGPRKVKVSQISDQLNNTELELLGQDALDEAFRTYRTRMGQSI